MDKFAEIVCAVREQYKDVKNEAMAEYVMYAIANTQMARICELFHKGAVEEREFLEDNLFSIATAVLYFIDILNADVTEINGDVLDALWDDNATYTYSWERFENLYVDFSHDFGLMFDNVVCGKKKLKKTKKYARYALYSLISIAGMFVTRKEFYELMLQEVKK